MPGAKPTTSRKRGRPPIISRVAIVEAAASFDLNELSMGLVAKELGVSTQSLYRHIDSSEQLVDLTIDYLASLWSPVEDTGQPLHEWLLAFGFGIRDFLIDHPGLAERAQVIRPGVPELMRMMEKYVGVLVARGHSPEVSFALTNVVVNITVSSVIRQSRFVSELNLDSEDRLPVSAAIRELDPKEIPILASLADLMDSAGSELFYRFTATSVIDGAIRQLVPGEDISTTQ